MAQRRDPARAVLDDRALASLLLGMVSHGTLVALRRTCRRWSSDTYSLAPDASRALARLTTWPAALRDVGADSEQSHEVRMREWRKQLLENLRMSCQDPEAFDRGAATSAGGQDESSGSHSGAAGHAHAACARAGHLADWFRNPVFRDTGTSDTDLGSALERALPGDVRQLFICSSRLSDEGVLRAVGRKTQCGDGESAGHWPALTDLCIVACSPRGNARQARTTGTRGGADAAGSSSALAALTSKPRQREPLSSATAVAPLSQTSLANLGAVGHGANGDGEEPDDARTGSSEVDSERAKSSASGGLTGSAMEPLTKLAASGRCRPLLRRLVLVGVPGVPLPALTIGCDLRMLMLHGPLSGSCVESIARCRALEIMKLSLEPRVGWAPFVRVFTECRLLRVVDIYSATDVSDQILGCVMLNLSRLEEFSSSRFGSHVDSSHVLSARLVEAFRAHFSRARKIVIDNIVSASVL